MLIRPADPGRDGAACAEIYAPFVRESWVSFEEQAPDAAAFARRIRLNSTKYPWLVAEDGEGIVAGYAYGSAHRERAAYRWAVDVAVYVSASHHRRGVGRALYKQLFALLAEQGFQVACAGVTLPNEASVALHEAFGFQPVGVYRRIGFKAGAWRDVAWWQRELAPPSDAPPAAPRPPSA